MSNFYIYDIETYPNIFTCTIKHVASGETVCYEISDRKNDFIPLKTTLIALREHDCTMVGFNNLAFDYPVLHYILGTTGVNAQDIYEYAMKIIKSPKKNKFTIWGDRQFVKQVDLYKIHHFDNPAKATSLKILEFNMRLKKIQELPYEPGMYLNHSQMDELIKYNGNDVFATEEFFKESLEHIDFRSTMSERYNVDFTNDSDVRIGEKFVCLRIEDIAPGSCYNGREARKTYRDKIEVKNILFNYIKFDNPVFQEIHKEFYNKTITNMRDGFKPFPLILEDGFKLKYACGGLHGCCKPKIFIAGNGRTIWDVDVTSYYPSIGIVNTVYPAHLGPVFCQVYATMKEERLKYKKGTPENKMLKLALNGTFGKTNSDFSPFYDPLYMFTITINGQLSLSMLIEWLITIPGLEMIQANTDGITFSCPDEYNEIAMSYCKHWEYLTKLNLEYVKYNRFFVRDVNNYIAEYNDLDKKGNRKLKLKSAYAFDKEWHKNRSALVVPKAVKAHLVDGKNVEEFICNHTDIMDFMLRTKVPKKGRLEWDGKKVQNVSRYYVSKEGGELIKYLPATKKQSEKGKTEQATRYHVGYKTFVCNDFEKLEKPIDYQFYIDEAYKLINPLRGKNG